MEIKQIQSYCARNVVLTNKHTLGVNSVVLCDAHVGMYESYAVGLVNTLKARGLNSCDFCKLCKADSKFKKLFLVYKEATLTAKVNALATKRAIEWRLSKLNKIALAVKSMQYSLVHPALALTKLPEFANVTRPASKEHTIKDWKLSEILASAIVTSYDDSYEKKPMQERVEYFKTSGLLSRITSGNVLELFKLCKEASDPLVFAGSVDNFISFYTGREVCYPVAYDATCSGIQLMAILLGDTVAALFTNVLPNPHETIIDIYQYVFDYAKGKLEQYAEELKASADNSAEAQKILMIIENASRLQIKKAMLAFMYGSQHAFIKTFGATVGKVVEQAYQELLPEVYAYVQKIYELFNKHFKNCKPYSMPFFRFDGKLCDYQQAHIDTANDVSVKYFSAVNRPTAIAPNSIHAMDSAVLGELSYRCMYEPEEMDYVARSLAVLENKYEDLTLAMKDYSAEDAFHYALIDHAFAIIRNPDICYSDKLLFNALQKYAPNASEDLLYSVTSFVTISYGYACHQVLSARMLKYINPVTLYYIDQHKEFFTVNIAGKSTYLVDAIKELLTELPAKPFEMLTIHDSFGVLPQYVNDLRQQYSYVLYHLSNGTSLDFMLSFFFSQSKDVVNVSFNKLPQKAREDILKQTYALS